MPHPKTQLTKSNSMEWKPLMEEGVQCDGIYVNAIRYDEGAQRSPTILLKFEPGATYPNHNHPGGEEVFVLEGAVTFGKDELSAGDFLFTPPDFRHAVVSKTGCVMLLSIPEEVVVMG